MFICTYIRRPKSPDNARTLCTLSLHAYSLKIRPGLIRAESAIKVDDPCANIGILYWGSEAARDIGERMEEARSVFAKAETYTVAPPEISMYEHI